MVIETTLKRRAAALDVGHRIATAVEERAKVAGESGMEFPRHVEELWRFARFLRDQPAEEPRIRSMFSLMAAQGDGDHYVPGENQGQLLGSLGVGAGKVPDPDATLTELVDVAIDDFLISHEVQLASVRARAKEAEDRATRAAEVEAEAAAAKARVLQLEADSRGGPGRDPVPYPPEQPPQVDDPRRARRRRPTGAP